MLVLFGCILALNNKISIGNVSTFLIYTNIFTKPFNEITALISDLLAGTSSINRIFAFLNEASNETINDKNIQDHILGKVEFKNVEFSYSNNKDFIRNLNLTVSSKESIAIVGQTGSGKTTIVNLLMRFYDIKSGEILIDDKNILDYNIDFLRQNIGMVLQDTKLFVRNS